MFRCSYIYLTHMQNTQALNNKLRVLDFWMMIICLDFSVKHKAKGQDILMIFMC